MGLASDQAEPNPYIPPNPHPLTHHSVAAAERVGYCQATSKCATGGIGHLDCAIPNVPGGIQGCMDTYCTPVAGCAFVSVNNRVGINSATPTTALDVGGTVTATAFVGDGSELTGVSGFATALSTDQTSPLNVFFKTPQQVDIGAGTSIQVESDATSGNVAFIREGIIHVAVGATFRVVSGTQLTTNVLGVF